MAQEGRNTPYDLEARTFLFAKNTRKFIKTIKWTITNKEDAKQLARSSGSIGANYIEANEALGKSDRIMHMRICRKEAKESRYWLRLLDVDGNLAAAAALKPLIRETEELEKIFGAIIKRLQ